METQNNYSEPAHNYPLQNLPNATAVLILGILSIISCCVYIFPSLVLGIIAIVLANKDINTYKATPDAYTIASYKNVKAGRTCAIVGLVLFGLALVCIIMLVVAFGYEVLLHPDLLKQYQQ